MISVNHLNVCWGYRENVKHGLGIAFLKKIHVYKKSVGKSVTFGNFSAKNIYMLQLNYIILFCSLWDVSLYNHVS